MISFVSVMVVFCEFCVFAFNVSGWTATCEQSACIFLDPGDPEEMHAHDFDSF